MSKADEKSFESFICSWLVEHGGYREVKVGTAQGKPTDFDPVLGLDTGELFGFIGETQGEAWGKLVTLLGGDPNSAQAQFKARLASEIDKRGTVDVLRRGVVEHGVTIQLAYFKPAHQLTPELAERYDRNRLTVTRQLPYEATSTKTLDLCLFVNGLPVATAELKNALTGQGTEHAKAQYRQDRDAKNVTLGRRAVVHFAMDTETVAMTTRLSGKTTQFLPFNRGHDGKAGNPLNPKGHRTAYVWEQVWTRDAWLDLLARFVHVDQPGKGAKASGRTIFPRFHQWDAVLAMEADARANGAGSHYLVQHSAGSGKSNTIAWLAHRLSSLHDDTDTKVFDKVVVITDRKVLDKQLQETISQFEHAHGLVQKIDTNSAQLAESLAGEQARIIITTLQKFPFVLDKVGSLPERRYAVIVDEAHSSQTGEAAKDLKLVLGATGTPEHELTVAELEDAGYAAEPIDPVEEALAAAVGARTKQPNISFFAFTATPKGRTLELFGRKNPATGKHEPFHVYSMRQAVEEGFILDVLANYVTYETYWNIEKATPDDPEYDPGKAKAAIARFVTLHEHVLAQKAEVIVEHFRTKVAHKIGGRAKAMVVTASRLHAVRYKQALEQYIANHGYGDIGVLVAFSGTVLPGDGDWTEAKLNGFPDSQTAAEFNTEAWQILVVAEKYQTGFDQPLLYAMYVDKTLTGLAAVQTLSRLNRTTAGKDGTFVLDFRNDAEDIRDAFEPWFGTTVAPPTDPNLLYDTRRDLSGYDVLWPDEVEGAVALLLGDAGKNTARIYAALGPTVDRFHALDEDDQSSFRDALNRFVRIYSFLSQVVSFTDVKLERDYVFCRALSTLIKGMGGGGVDLSSEVELTHLRMEQTFAGSVALESGDGEVSTIFSGTGKAVDKVEEALSTIIARLNERFGTDFDPADRVFFDTIADKLSARSDIQQAAAVNSPENFMLTVEKAFEGGVVDQLGSTEDLAVNFLNSKEVQAAVLAVYAPLIQGKALVAHQEFCPIGDLLGPDRESQFLEYKASFRTHFDGGEVFKPLETASLKTIAAFLNSREGGTLLIGVADDGTPVGLAADLASLHRHGKDDGDRFQLHLATAMSNAFGDAAASMVHLYLHTITGNVVCRVHVAPAPFPVPATVVVVDKAGAQTKESKFFVRVANGTKALPDDERAKYILGRWPGGAWS